MFRRAFCALFLSTLVVLASNAGAVEQGPENAGKALAKSPQEAPRETISETHHILRLAGEELRYVARTGRMLVEDEASKKKGKIFFVAYELETAQKSERPITFAFNGGPGAASVWLHLGALGPRRVVLNEDGTVLPPPARMTDNAFTWLTFSDLVFVDPIGTGFSRSEAEGDQGGKDFYGVTQDIASVGEFIRLFLTRYERWLSPKFIVGESYGATRAAGLSEHLHDEYGVDLNGVVLISPALDFDTILFGSSNDLPYVLSLPSYAATACYHDLVEPGKDKDFNLLLDEVEDFSRTAFLQSLARGGGLSVSERQRMIEQVARYTGLSQRFVDLANLRVTGSQFVKELLRDQRKVIGRMDSTITGFDPEPAKTHASYDPSLDTLYGPFAGAINAYLREDLKYESDLTYEFLNLTVNQSWDWNSSLPRGQGYLDVSKTLRDAMVVSSHLKVFIAGGYFDLATPYFTVKYIIDHMGLNAALRANLTLRFYPAGHMLYTHRNTLEALTGDIRVFYEHALEASVHTPAGKTDG